MLALQRLRRKEMNKLINDDFTTIVVDPPPKLLESGSLVLSAFLVFKEWILL
jgi:hypothetical protein